MELSKEATKAQYPLQVKVVNTQRLRKPCPNNFHGTDNTSF